MTKENTFYLKDILILAFVICAYLIGSGFATGQELLQYFASYGLSGLGTGAVVCAMLIFMTLSFFTLGKERNISNSHDVFIYYCGNKLGPVFEFFAFAYLIIQPIVYFTGVAATTNEAFGTKPIIGAAVMGVAVVITVLSGLKKLVEAIGSVGIVLIIIVNVLSIMYLIRNSGNIMAGNEIVKSMNILQPSSSWAMSGFLYGTFNVLGMAAIMPLIGANSKSQKVNIYGSILGSVIFCLTVGIITLAFISDISEIGTKLVPMLHIAKSINPMLGSAFSIIVLAGVYTSCSPMFWNFCSRVMDENNKYYKIFVITLGSVAVVIGALLRFDKAINIFYLFSGYTGAIFFVFVLVKEIRVFIAKRNITN